MVGAGIGNVLESLYAVEYCIRKSVNVALYILDVPESFKTFIKNSYSNIYCDDLGKISCNNLIHSFTVESHFEVEHENYIYIHPDNTSSNFRSETEQYLNIVSAIYPGGRFFNKLEFLNEQMPEYEFNTSLEVLYLIYPGCNHINPVKRWPHFLELEKKLGSENVIWIAGEQDFDFEPSYYYPTWWNRILSQKILNNKTFWQICKNFGLLKRWSHYPVQNKPNVFIEKFSWEELVYILRRCKKFFGNDGGVMHLAAVCGAVGFAIFGPTSVRKNKPKNDRIECISLNHPCQPCQFGPAKIKMAIGYINCPYGVKCLQNIKAEDIIAKLK